MKPFNLIPKILQFNNIPEKVPTIVLEAISRSSLSIWVTLSLFEDSETSHALPDAI